MQPFLKGSNLGKYVFRTSNNETIFIKNIITENLTVLEECLKYIETNLNYKFQSFTIDCSKGVIQLLERLYPNIPIQLCQFPSANFGQTTSYRLQMHCFASRLHRFGLVFIK
ncbi:MAG TPA: hypothetical protein VLL98_00570 [Rickettsiales bacterium]|nr:hypothetical protein [Rickettsiales bacterium]